MKLFVILSVAAGCAFAATAAEAVMIDFEDLPLDQQYFVGDTFTSTGVMITGQTYYWGPGNPTNNGFSQVESGLMAGGSGLELQVNNINLGFDLMPGTNSVEVTYGAYGGNLNLTINGDLEIFAPDFGVVDGMIIGGVDVAATANPGPGGTLGVLTLTGPMSDFAIGGQELWIDDVSIVPEPTTCVIMGIGVLGLCGRRRR